MSPLILLKLCVLIFNYRRLLYLLLFPHFFWRRRLGNILRVLHCFLSDCFLFFHFYSLFEGFPLFHSLLVWHLHLLSKLLNKYKITCIFYIFFLFYCQSSPPMLAPKPPNLDHPFASVEPPLIVVFWIDYL